MLTQTDVRTAGIPALVAALGHFTDQLQALLGGASAAQLNWKPDAAEWSLGQVVDHLIVANTTYIPQIEALLAGTKQTTLWERLPFTPRLFANVLISSLEPARRAKVKTVKVFEPGVSAVEPQILSAFERNQAHMAELMSACARLDAERIIITSPAAAFITYSLLDAFRIIVIHEYHHYEQMTGIMAAPGFPGG